MLLNDDFLLTTDWAKRLYHDHAEKMPIIDYHCHLVPAEIYEDKRYKNLAQVWLYDNGFGDHYKWRIMRANGTPESVIRGDDDYAKFLAYVDTIEHAVGNPIYEWSHLELRRVFGIDLTINHKNAKEIWDRANAELAKPEFSAKGLIRKFNVKCICTTDNPASDLKYHKLLAEQEAENGFKVLPTFRPDDLMNIDLDSFASYCETLSEVSGVKVTDFASLKQAAAQRVQYFHEVGGRLADQGANTFYFTPAADDQVAKVVAKRLAGEQISAQELREYQTSMTLFLMGEYAAHGWTMQIHGNCFRNDSSKYFKELGVDCGFDSAGDQPDFVYQHKLLFDAAEQAGALPNVIFYSLNDTDWLAIASLCGSFQAGGVKQRMQFGNAWWFNDTFSGMKKQLTMFAEQGLLSRFTGMLTDSRSFLSYPRHEYFRRVLCQLVGEWVERGQAPEDEELLGKMVEDISYNNAHDYFGFFGEAK